MASLTLLMLNILYLSLATDVNSIKKID